MNTGFYRLFYTHIWCPCQLSREVRSRWFSQACDLLPATVIPATLLWRVRPMGLHLLPHRSGVTAFCYLLWSPANSLHSPYSSPGIFKIYFVICFWPITTMPLYKLSVSPFIFHSGKKWFLIFSRLRHPISSRKIRSLQSLLEEFFFLFDPPEPQCWFQPNIPGWGNKF